MTKDFPDDYNLKYLRGKYKYLKMMEEGIYNLDMVSDTSVLDKAWDTYYKIKNDLDQQISIAYVVAQAAYVMDKGLEDGSISSKESFFENYIGPFPEEVKTALNI